MYKQNSKHMIFLRCIIQYFPSDTISKYLDDFMKEVKEYADKERVSHLKLHC